MNTGTTTRSDFNSERDNLIAMPAKMNLVFMVSSRRSLDRQTPTR
jgi:hypothetical protein